MNLFQRLLLSAGLALAPTVLEAAGPVQFKPAKLIQTGSSNLAPGLYATPIATDWNGDGKKDLLVGYQPASKIALYLNSGTDRQPQFNSGIILQFFDGRSNVWRDIHHPSYGCGAPAPWVCDFDADGDRDLLVGLGEEGEVLLYRNTNTDAQPILINPERLRAGTGFVNVTLRANPIYHDWDEDGLPDLICGSGEGYVYFFKNTNTIQSPWFAPAITLTAGGTNRFLNRSADGALTSTPRAVPRVLDWDGDGLKDLVCSSDAGVFWCRNAGSNPKPVLEAPMPIYAPKASGYRPLVTGNVPGARMRIAPTDWNSDGILDLLVGNADGTTAFYEGYKFDITGLHSQADGKLRLEWSSCELLSYRVFARDLDTGLESLVATDIPSAGTNTTWTVAPHEGHGQIFRVQVTPPGTNP